MGFFAGLSLFPGIAASLDRSSGYLEKLGDQGVMAFCSRGGLPFRVFTSLTMPQKLIALMIR